MQRYAEGYTKQNYSGKRALPRVLLVAATLTVGVLAAVAVLFFLGISVFSAVFAAVLALAVLSTLKFSWRYVDVAYEYILVEDELRVVKILGDVVRRPLLVIALRTVTEKGSMANMGALPATVLDTRADDTPAEFIRYENREGEGVLLWNAKPKILALMPWGKNV